MSYVVLLYYQFTELDQPEEIHVWQVSLCKSLGLKGRILVGKEGINGTIAGEALAIEEYKKEMWAHPAFKAVLFKESGAVEMPFPKLKVKLRKEIITLQIEGLDIAKRGEYISPESLEALYESGEEFYIMDTRNDYESVVGYFDGAIVPEIQHFSELPSITSTYDELKDKKVITYCTGGIRCEKATTLLRKQGYKEVYQLEGGIISYILKYPNKHFKGNCYIFDNRVQVTQEDLAKNGVISQAPQSPVPQ